MNDKTILFVSKRENDSSTRYRALAYFELLRENGWIPSHHTVHGARSRVMLLCNAVRADVVVILRKTFGTPYLLLLHLCSKHLVFDLDDAIFCRDNGTSPPRLMRRFARIVRRCRQVWAGNSYLADAVRLHNPSVFELPTSLDPEKYAVQVTKPIDTLDLVWIGSSSTRKYLMQALPILEKLAHDFPFLRLKIVADFNLKTEKLCVVSIPWSETGEAEALGSAHIGIAPMPDNPRTRGKCALKVLQYMAAKLPVVSSPSGVNKDIVEHGVTGFLAHTDVEWKDAIETLIHNADLRRELGNAGRKRVIESYSIDVTFRKMNSRLETLLTNRPRY